MERSVSEEVPRDKIRYNQIISNSGGIPTTLDRLRFLEQHSTHKALEDEAPTSPRIQSNASPRVMIPKSWFKKKKKKEK